MIKDENVKKLILAKEERRKANTPSRWMKKTSVALFVVKSFERPLCFTAAIIYAFRASK